MRKLKYVTGVSVAYVGGLALLLTNYEQTVAMVRGHERVAVIVYVAIGVVLLGALYIAADHAAQEENEKAQPQG